MTKGPSGIGISFDRVTKRYGKLTAVEDVSLDIEPGEFLTLLGPSGSGKTTLLMMLAGFQDITAGDIRVGGQSIAATPPEKRNFGMVFQGYALFPHMSVRGNIAYPLEIRRMPPAAIQARVNSMLDLVQLQGFADRYPQQLSGGQQQRVALARALSFEPRVLLLDEPLGALDRKLRADVQDQLKDIHNRVGTTFVYVTHDQEEALTMSDRIAIMNRGGLVQVGKPAELYERPRTAFAASFLGKSNFISRNGRTYALRPEKIDIAPAGHGRGPNRHAGTIGGITYLGATLKLSVSVPALGAIEVHVPAWRNAGEFSESQAVDIGWSDDAQVEVEAGDGEKAGMPPARQSRG
ncbi:MAG: ABC transporter ATP-binding protein [Aestuariivirga sp.]|jgi:putative spermidine/putrescine transport system ATP-binding protein|uniref:ABC transporter ATP-binding protein n=1 Tax=Aestuariivirga sp. TaxID=2650926 RepID=UPI0038D12951